MAKILNVKPDVIVIGLDNGVVKEVRPEDCQFEAKVGLEVEVYESESSLYVVEKKPQQHMHQNPNNQGININISNDNKTTAPTYLASGKVVSKVVYLLLTFFWEG